MAIYRSCFLDEADRIREAQERDFPHDQRTTDHAAAIVAGRGTDRMRIGQATRLVEHHDVTSPQPGDPKAARR